MVTLSDFSPCADRVAKCLDVEQKEKCTFKMIMNHLNDLHSAGVEANLKYMEHSCQGLWSIVNVAFFTRNS